VGCIHAAFAKLLWHLVFSSCVYVVFFIYAGLTINFHASFFLVHTALRSVSGIQSMETVAACEYMLIVELVVV